MAKPKGSKFKKNNDNNKRKKGEKKSHPRGGGFGFTKSKQLKEIYGESGSPISAASIRSIKQFNNGEEEVYIVSSGSIRDEPSKLAKFNELSTISIINATTAVPHLEGPENDLGFFFDSTPAAVPNIPKEGDEIIKEKATPSNYQQQKKKILVDDSIYLSSDEDDEDNDMISISSSEDVDMLQALSHWGQRDILQFEDNKILSDDEDYAMLLGVSLEDICQDSSDYEEEVGDILMEEELDFDSLDNVPESLKHNYRRLIHQEKKRAKKLKKSAVKQQRNNKNSTTPTKPNKLNIIDQIIHDFIRNDHVSTYTLTNLTCHGRSMIVPRLAKVFHLKISESSNKKNVILTRTKQTSVPTRFEHRTPFKNNAVKKKGPVIKSRVDFKAYRDDRNHGKLVASESEPISSNNIGHRMLAAMGWKQGNAIGNKQDGIKEPVQVYMRANRRGLGA